MEPPKCDDSAGPRAYQMAQNGRMIGHPTVLSRHIPNPIFATSFDDTSNTARGETQSPNAQPS